MMDENEKISMKYDGVMVKTFGKQESGSTYPSLTGSLIVDDKKRLSLTVAIMNSIINPDLFDSFNLNEEALNFFVMLLKKFSPQKAAHLWAEKFYDDNADYRSCNPLIAMIIVSISQVTREITFYKIGGGYEVWIKQNHIWVTLFTKDVFTKEGRKEYISSLKGVEVNDSSLGIQEQALNDLRLWKYPFLGLSDQPVIAMRAFNIKDIQKIVLLKEFSEVLKQTDFKDYVSFDDKEFEKFCEKQFICAEICFP